MSRSFIPPPSVFSVLFVCTSNQLASPIAEGLFRWRVQNDGANSHQWRIESAGTWAQPGQPASLEAREAMHRRGISIDEHRTRCVSRDLLAQFQLVLTMDDVQKNTLEIEYPEYASRLYKLTEMSGQNLGLVVPRAPDIQECERLVQELSMWLVMGDACIQQLAWRKGTGRQLFSSEAAPGTSLH